MLYAATPGWWLPGEHWSEQWQLNAGILGSVLGDCWLFNIHVFIGALLSVSYLMQVGIVGGLG